MRVPGFDACHPRSGPGAIARVGRVMLAWIELTDTPLDGKVWELDGPPTHVTAGSGVMTMVATGTIRWREDSRPIEVYVPEERLDLWRAEHDVE